jgi:hypothetical protein
MHIKFILNYPKFVETKVSVNAVEHMRIEIFRVYFCSRIYVWLEVAEVNFQIRLSFRQTLCILLSLLRDSRIQFHTGTH